MATRRYARNIAGNTSSPAPIPPRNAAVLAYICQLLLGSVGAVQNEITCAKELSAQDLLRQILPNLRSPKPSHRVETAQDKTQKTIIEVVCGPGCEDLADILTLKPAPQVQNDKSPTTS